MRAPIKKTQFMVIVALLICVFTLLACDDAEKEAGLGIFLVTNDEMVLSEQHVKAYHPETHEIELNSEGIEKWNSYMTYSTIPKLNQTLYGKDFVVKVKGEEIYRGKFWSMLSSASCPGIVILDALFKLDDTHNTIQIQFGYAIPQSGNDEDPRNNPKVLNFFEERGLLK
ncbi:MAG: hypothetical protein PHV74_02570 [Dehalococcoidia bacterium]|nr:hypothetical protein [Dehalococcoidia bacterium]